MKTALITGASSGIGLELAKIHASQGHNLVIVARSLSKLEELRDELKSNYTIEVWIVEKDLSKDTASKEIFDFTLENSILVDYLINNAGFGDYRNFDESDWGKTNQMIQLNITALTELTHLFIPQMKSRGYGKIMNVASTAAFQPGPGMAVYFATKAYVLHFSEAIDNELRKFGISVTALCPGATESGFQAAASMEDSKVFKHKNIPTSKEVAEYGFKAMMKGKAVAIHGIMNYIMANAIRFTPRSLVIKVVRLIQDKQ